ncbi:hypothetical protein K443DRAFT_5919 [Laccaria amethystina LaAM-08-1]|uniref:Uncharacterized protein n=1 Tax=Laccaria amethystina LaAM-08-1 TaxID=1095629 RepID=A0A0C9XMN6_9AGAR|nr:hypothetical protein K443DRAFT_5919 [Laccaria amethystina LaAM-08-1]
MPILQEDREPFLGLFVLEMFVMHLKKMITSVGGYDHTVGGLAMAVGVLELAFEVIGEGLTKNLDVKKHWPTILQTATSRVSNWNADGMDGDEDVLEDDP